MRTACNGSPFPHGCCCRNCIVPTGWASCTSFLPFEQRCRRKLLLPQSTYSRQVVTSITTCPVTLHSCCAVHVHRHESGHADFPAMQCIRPALQPERVCHCAHLDGALSANADKLRDTEGSGRVSAPLDKPTAAWLLEPLRMGCCPSLTLTRPCLCNQSQADTSTGHELVLPAGVCQQCRVVRAQMVACADIRVPKRLGGWHPYWGLARYMFGVATQP